ncbi:MAG: helix-turn-helix domain-containing protein [Rickettsiales bacterium]|jgi:transcriptional regulator with XRE-family HTH domain|nr:helix-turn-helix domain-containing protein [Rickettsiales bacterium]
MSLNNDKYLLYSIGARVAFIRKERGMTQGDIAATSKRILNTISNIEQGKVDAKITTLSAVAHALRVPLPELIDFDPNGFVKEEDAQTFIEAARALRSLNRRELIIALNLIKSLRDIPE